MRQLTYHGPGARLRLPSGRTVTRGDTVEVTNDDADAATRAAGINVTVADDPDGDTPEADGEGHTDHDSEEE